MKWLVNLFRREEQESISIGSRIHTKFGWGIVVGGSIRVNYDKSPVPLQPTNKQWTHDLKELSE